MLNHEELVEAQSLITNLTVGVRYKLKEIYGQKWINVKSPTTFGKRFKQSVLNGKVLGLQFEYTKSDNHTIYTLA
jgi:Domain of unknown function (DUF1413)